MTCKEYCKKGSLISIKCRVQMNHWVNNEGKNMSSLEVIGEKITLIPTGKSLQE